MLSEPLCKRPARFPNVFFFTVYPATPEPVDHSTLLQDCISISGVYQEVLDCVATFEIHLHPMFSADVLAAFTHALDIWDNYVRLVVTASFIGCTDCPLISVFLSLLFDVSSGSGPFWVLESFKGFTEVVFFLFQQMFVEQTVLDLCFKVLITLYLADR